MEEIVRPDTALAVTCMGEVTLLPFTGLVICTVAGFTVTVCGALVFDKPRLSVTVAVTLYVPAEL